MNLNPLKFPIMALIGISAVFSCAGKSKDTGNENSTETTLLTPVYASVNVNIADVKKEPKKHAERVSQALYNEDVRVLAYKNNYVTRW